MEKIHYPVCPLCAHSDIAAALETQDFSVSREVFSLWDCRGCGLRFTQDVPAPGAIGAYYQSEDYISHSDTRKGLINRLYHLARAYMLGSKRRMIAGLSPSKTLLDVGCGTGYFMHHLQERGYQVKGVEVDAHARTFAKEKFGLEVLPPEALLEERLPGPFGVISMWHVLEHVHEPGRYLDRLRALLEPDGILLIAVPNFQSADAAWYGRFWAAYDVPRHLWHFSPATLQTLASRHGFRLIGKKRLPLDPFYVSLLSEKYRGSGISGMIRAGLAGGWSSGISWMNIDRSSSLVYIFEKS